MLYILGFEHQVMFQRSDYSWYINDNQINTNINQISFKKKNNNEKSRLSVKIENPKSLLQTQKKTYIINTNN